jgi:magnesium transporter
MTLPARTVRATGSQGNLESDKHLRAANASTSRRTLPETLGAPPGSLTTRRGANPSRVVARRYGVGEFEELIVFDPAQLADVRQRAGYVWVEVTGLADAALISGIGRSFGLHVLSVEDMFDPTQRAKVEFFDDHTFVVLNTLSAGETVQAQLLGLFFGERFVVSVEDAANEAFEPVRQRLRRGQGKIRERAADYLAYALIDTVIDHYFPVVEAFDDRLEQVEEAILAASSEAPMDLARGVRPELRTLRHAVGPAREVITSLIREDLAPITDETRLHLRDCYDHIIQLQEMVEASREIAASLLDVYVSAVSLRTNAIMKVLTIIATIFIPLTFITGLYGMNFDTRSSPLNMPELRWYWGYPFALVLMLGTSVASLLYFRSKGWLGKR